MRRSLFVLCALFAACSSEPAVQPTAPLASADAGTDSAATLDGSESQRPTWSAEQRRLLEELAPKTLPVRADLSNAFADNMAAAKFGQALFFSPLFAGRLLDGDNDGSSFTLGKKGESGKVACAGCHQPEAQFSDHRTRGQQISLGSGWVLRKSPSLLDVSEVPIVMWDGRRDALYNQVFGPIESPLEMNSSRLFVAQQVHRLHRAEYEAIFGPMPPLDDTARFPPLSGETAGCTPSGRAPKEPCEGISRGTPGDRGPFDNLTLQDQGLVTRVVVNVGKAIGAYERRLRCGPGRLDTWVNRDVPLSPSEERGAHLFVGKAKCVTCHSGPSLSDHQFYNVGLLPETVAVVFRDTGDVGASAGLVAGLADPLNTKGVYSDGYDGRLDASPVEPEMLGAFRTPMLRCVSKRTSFMHTGHMKDLVTVVQFFNRGGDRGGYPGKSVIVPLGLTDAEVVDLANFLGTLDGPGPDLEWTARP
jgi:cytochrome c peroxidase